MEQKLSFEDLKKRSLRICVLNPNYNDSAFEGYDFAKDPRVNLPKDLPWTWEFHEIDKALSLNQLQKLRQKNFDLYFNFCDGAPDQEYAGIDVVKALESFNVPFVGCDSKFYATTKKAMKKIFAISGVQTPQYLFAYNEQDIECAVKRMTNYPLIVKHHDSYSSIGLTKKCKVMNEDELREQARIMINQFEGALIEEFIEGDEYTVLVLANPENPEDPIVLDPIKYRFGEGETFKHYNLKWIDYTNMGLYRIDDEDLTERLRQVAKKTFAWWDISAGFGRLDIRVNQAKEIFVLEINAIPSIFYPNLDGSADLIISNDTKWNAEEIVYLMMQTAFTVHAKRQKPYHVSYRGESDVSGLFASRDIKQGEVIRCDENQPVNLISKKGAEQKFKNAKKSWFRRYALPLNNGLYAIPSDDLEDWEPMNHSCQPNVWYGENELSLVTMRDIKTGEELTIDYCLFSSDKELIWDCECGTGMCRKLITGEDYKKKDLMERYNGHFYIPLQNKVDEILKNSN